MKRKILLLLSLTGIILVSSCASMVNDMVQKMMVDVIIKTPAINKVFLHDGVEIGDYAIFESISYGTVEGQNASVDESSILGNIIDSISKKDKKFKGVTTENYEVLNVADGKVTILYKIHITTIDTDTGKAVKDSDFNLTNKFITDMKGNVLKAFYVTESGMEHQLKILTKGEPGYIDYDIRDGNPVKVEVEDEEYEAFELLDEMVANFSSSGKVKVFRRSIFTPHVNFCNLRRYSVVNEQHKNYYTKSSTSGNVITTKYYEEIVGSDAAAIGRLIEQGNRSE